MIRIITILSFLLLTVIVHSQITITYNDLPTANTSYVLSISNQYSTIDPRPTGANFIWDFTSLLSAIQKKDTFIAPTGAPTSYQPYFNSFVEPKPDMAIITDHLSMFDSINAYGPYSLGDIYNYYKKDSNTFSLVGFAMNIKGIPVSVVYRFPDLIYALPLTYGEKDLYISFYETPPLMSSIFYYASHQTRNNHVDGWGTLKTPYGVFQVLRMRSEITSVDTFHNDSISKKFAKPKTVEYKWLGKNSGSPLLKIVTQFSDTNEKVISISYLDSVSKVTAGIELTNNFENLSVYPNPFKNNINVDFHLNSNSFVGIELFNLYGQKVTDLYRNNLAPGSYHQSFQVNLGNKSSSCYFMKINTGSDFVIKKIMQIAD